MTYFGFLLRFLGVPLLLLCLLLARDWRSGRRLPDALRQMPAWLALLVHVVLAVIYTTPWDNYLVATRVWWYDPQLVTGITLGWVPLEEYTFFVVQTLLTGSWLIWLSMRLRVAPWPTPRCDRIRWLSAGAAGMIWVSSMVVLISGQAPGTYLGLELAWMLPPIILQLAVGAHLLWHQRRLVTGALLPSIVYLSVADALAIGSGTWTIDPVHSTGILLGGVLPVEEIIFFTLTNTLIVFGMVLLMGTDIALLRNLGARFRRNSLVARSYS
jgi:lycopene cyclase domain-containing protein